MDFNQEEDALLLENIDEFVNDENKIVSKFIKYILR